MANMEYKNGTFITLLLFAHVSSRNISILPQSLSLGIQHYDPSRDSHFYDNAAAISVILTVI